MPQKLGHEKIYVQEIAAVNLSKKFFLKNAKKICKSNNPDVNHDWINELVLIDGNFRKRF